MGPTLNNPIPHEPMIDKQIAMRAYEYWEQRGRPSGSSEVDWYRAIDDLRHELSLRPVTRPMVSR
jgi:hypothetical protein